jgi:hypothetical protein
VYVELDAAVSTYVEVVHALGRTPQLRPRGNAREGDVETRALPGRRCFPSQQRFQRYAVARYFNELRRILIDQLAADTSLRGRIGQRAPGIPAQPLTSGYELTSKTAKAQISGSCTENVLTTDVLTVKISGSGSLTYSGSARVTEEIRGSGKLIKSLAAAATMQPALRPA